MKSVVAFFLLIATAVVALPVEENFLNPRIFGGQEAQPNEFPHQVGIYITNPPEKEGDPVLHTWCGGSLISKQFILTAAHCLYGTTKAVVMLGAHNVKKHQEEGRILVPVAKENFIIHTSYNPEISENDIALMKLPGKISLTDKIQTINLPKPTQVQSALEGKLATTTGWGKLGDRANTSDILRYTQLKILKDRVCNFYYPDTFQPVSKMCVEGKLKSVCPGDSGGPLFIEETDGSKTIIGITSHSRREGCQEGYPTVFTRVTAFLDWISEHAKITDIK